MSYKCNNSHCNIQICFCHNLFFPRNSIFRLIRYFFFFVSTGPQKCVINGFYCTYYLDRNVRVCRPGSVTIRIFSITIIRRVRSSFIFGRACNCSFIIVFRVRSQPRYAGYNRIIPERLNPRRSHATGFHVSELIPTAAHAHSPYTARAVRRAINRTASWKL